MLKNIFFFLFLFCFFIVHPSEADVNIGVAVSSDNSSFFLSISNYFHVPQRQVLYVREKHIPDDQIPVVFFLSQRLNIAPSQIIDLRLSGKSWLDITLHFGYGPDIFYFPVKEAATLRPPYGKAYGYYKNKPKKDWKLIKLQDDDIINLVNLRFVSEHYRYDPEQIIKLREGNRHFYRIVDEIDKEKSKSKTKKDTHKEKKKSGKNEQSE